MKLLNRRILILLVALGIVRLTGAGAGFGQAAGSDTPAARALALQELLGSVEGVATEPPRISRTKDGYLRFVMAPAFSHFAVDVADSNQPEAAADAFLEQWRGLFVNESEDIEFTRVCTEKEASRTYVRYQQIYTGLEVFGAEIVVEVKAESGVSSADAFECSQ